MNTSYPFMFNTLCYMQPNNINILIMSLICLAVHAFSESLTGETGNAIMLLNKHEYSYTYMYIRIFPIH